MSPQGLVFVVHVLLLTAGIEVIHGLEFPFGASAGDTGHVSQSTLGVKVSKNGFLSFTMSGLNFDVDKDFGSITIPIICVFCADFKPQKEHKIWRRLSAQASDLKKVQELVRKYEDFGAAFTPTWVFVVTWDAVGTFDPKKLGNTLQIAVANTAAMSLVYMEYDAINWVAVNTKVGFTKGDGKSYYAFPQSQNMNITRLNTSSNIGVDGQFLFRVDQERGPSPPTVRTSSSKNSNATHIKSTVKALTLRASTLAVGVMIGGILSVAIVLFIRGRGHGEGMGKRRVSPPSSY